MPLRDLFRDRRVIDGLSVTAGGLLTVLVWSWLQPDRVDINSVCEQPARVPPTQAVFYFPSEAE